MKFALIFWILAGVVTEGIVFAAYRHSLAEGEVMYGGRGPDSKKATQESDPEIYSDRMLEMKNALWQIPVGWIILTPLVLNRINRKRGANQSR